MNTAALPTLTPVPDPLLVVLVLVFLSLAPYLAMLTTSYMKIVVVLSLLRNALGIQTIPPNTVINGLAIVLSIYVMAPIFQDSYKIITDQYSKNTDLKTFLSNIEPAQEPVKKFLIKHSNDRERAFFLGAAKTLWGEGNKNSLTPESMIILIPSFTVSELTQAFEIGFLIYLPFVAIDIIVSNILLALGMMMVSPMTISLPFKLLLFVLIDGWARMIHGLVMSYQY